jgi:hypothetical protein
VNFFPLPVGKGEIDMIGLTLSGSQATLVSHLPRGLMIENISAF